MKATRRRGAFSADVIGRAESWLPVIAGLAVSVAPCVRSEELPDRANYARFWEEQIKPAKGATFRHSTYNPRVGLSPQVAEKVREVVESELKKSVRAGKLKLDSTRQLAITNSATHGYTRALLEEDVLREFSDRATEGFKDFLDYVERPDLLPRLDFRLLDEHTEFEAPTIDSAVMYLTWNRMIRVSSRFHYKGERKVVFARDLALTDSVRGQLVGVFTGSFDKEQGVSLRNVMHHAYGGVGYSAISSYAIPMSELFPLFLREMAADRINKEINEAWVSQGRPIPFNKEDHQAIITKWDVQEDSLVEALIDEFIGGRLDKLGFTRGDWEKYCRHGNSPQYALSAAIKKKIRKLGAPEVLRLYIEEPDKLF